MDQRHKTEDCGLKTVKGQVAVEGFTTITIVLLLYATLVIMTISRDDEMRVKTELMDRRDACIAVHSSVSSVLAGGDGTQVTFELRSKDDVYVNGNRVEVGSTNSYACSLPGYANLVTLSGGTIQVINEGGIVTLQNA